MVVVERLHPSDVARGGELVRSPWADVPSGNPLALLEPRSRAVYLLLVAGESAAEVGARLVRDLRGRFVPDPELAAARTLASVSRALGLSPAARARAGRLRAIVPDRELRWLLILVGSGVFPDRTALAQLLGIHRATLYRRMEELAALRVPVRG